MAAPAENFVWIDIAVFLVIEEILERAEIGAMSGRASESGVLR